MTGREREDGVARRRGGTRNRGDEEELEGRADEGDTEEAGRAKLGTEEG